MEKITVKKLRSNFDKLIKQKITSFSNPSTIDKLFDLQQNGTSEKIKNYIEAI